MFGIAQAVVQSVSYLKAYQEEANRFDDYCKTLPIEEANKLRAERNRQREETLKHQRALEVAREGRSLNFWGDR